MRNRVHLLQPSKLLSYALRHGAEKLGLNMAPDGFVAVSELLKLKKFREFNLPLIQSISANCLKQRFALKEDGGMWFVRANQGHSTKHVSSSELLTPVLSVDAIPTGTCIHGTYRRCLVQILARGLFRMKRNHIHFTPHLAVDPTRPHSGFRSSCDTLIYVDVAAALADGIKFFMSSNGVILSPGNKRGFIPPRFFAKIVDRQTNNIITTAAPRALPHPASAASWSFLVQERAQFKRSALKESQHTSAIKTYLGKFTSTLQDALNSSPEAVQIKIKKLFRETVSWDVVANKPERADRPVVGADVSRLMTQLSQLVAQIDTCDA